MEGIGMKQFASSIKHFAWTLLLLMGSSLTALAQNKETIHMKKEQLNLTQQWDKTFPLSNKVEHRKVTFINRFGVTLAADLYMPKGATDKLPAIAVSGPFGAVKEQASGLYAQHLAEQGFLTLAFDPSFIGESGGKPRYTSSMDINTEDFCAAIDYLACHKQVDADRIGIVGICGWGGIALNAAALDPRIKATVSVTLYNLTRVTQQGYFDRMDEAARHQLKMQLAQQRTEEFRAGEIKPQGGLPDHPAVDAPDFLKQYVDYYKREERGYHPRSLNSNKGWNITTQLMRLNQDLWTAADEIRTPVLIVHGEKAHSRYFGEEAYQKLTSGAYAANKELFIVPGATHCDLYDGGQGNFIPWSKITTFFQTQLNYQTVNDMNNENKKQEQAISFESLQTAWSKGTLNTAYAPYFIGDSFLAPVVPKNLPKEEKTIQGYTNVTFEPGCRNNWHIHHGSHQILICVAGRGWYQEWGKAPIALKAGDIIDIPEGVKHWHGAQADAWFQHLATQVVCKEEAKNEWLEAVSDEDYNSLKTE